MIRGLLVVAALAALAVPASAATCYKPNPAGGSTAYECVRGEELPVDAPGPVQSTLPTVDEGELKAIEKLMNGAVQAAEPVQAAPAQ